jgi:tetratricopeptide (TPR) repeat protein
MAARIALGLLVVVALAWLGLGLRNARLEADGARLIGDSPADASLARLAEARDDYRRAEKLSADTGPAVRVAGLANFTGHPREALEQLRDVVRREPENFDAWLLMSSVAADLDSPLAARARARARELNPLQFRRRG